MSAGALGGQKRVVNPPGQELQEVVNCLTRVLETKLGSS